MLPRHLRDWGSDRLNDNTSLLYFMGYPLRLYHTNDSHAHFIHFGLYYFGQSTSSRVRILPPTRSRASPKTVLSDCCLSRYCRVNPVKPAPRIRMSERIIQAVFQELKNTGKTFFTPSFFHKFKGLFSRLEIIGRIYF